MKIIKSEKYTNKSFPLMVKNIDVAGLSLTKLPFIAIFDGSSYAVCYFFIGEEGCRAIESKEAITNQATLLLLDICTMRDSWYTLYVLSVFIGFLYPITLLSNGRMLKVDMKVMEI